MDLPTLPLWADIICFIVGCAFIFFAADGLVDNIRDVAKFCKVSPFLIGLLVVGIDGEETVASVASAIDNLDEVSIGNVVGNTIMAITLCFGFPAVIYKTSLNIKYSKNKINNRNTKYHLILIIVCQLLILFSYLLTKLNNNNDSYNLLFSGISTIFLFVVYICANLYQFCTLRRSRAPALANKVEKSVDSIEDMEISSSSDSSSSSSSSDMKHAIVDDAHAHVKYNNDNIYAKQRKYKKKLCVKIVLMLISLIFVLIGGDLLVYATDGILKKSNVLNESFFGYIIIAFATNIEEIALIVISKFKNNVSIGIAGMIGKIIWNVALTYGICSLIIVSIKYKTIDLINIIYMIIITIYWAILIYFRKLNRIHGVILLALFVGFIAINAESTFGID